MPADIHLLPHRACVSRPLLLGERRFLGLFCPDTLAKPGSRSEDRCRLCGHSNAKHQVRYRVRWAFHEDQMKSLVRNAQCPKCHHQVKDQALIEVKKLRGSSEVELYTLSEFSALMKSPAWSTAAAEYGKRSRN